MYLWNHKVHLVFHKLNEIHVQTLFSIVTNKSLTLDLQMNATFTINYDAITGQFPAITLYLACVSAHLQNFRNAKFGVTSLSPISIPISVNCPAGGNIEIPLTGGEALKTQEGFNCATGYKQTTVGGTVFCCMYNIILLTLFIQNINYTKY